MFWRKKQPFDESIAVDISEQDGIRSMHLGSDSVQSAMRLSNPYELVIGYTRSLMGFLLFCDVPKQSLMIGLGGGSLAKFFHRYCPETHNTVVELLPQVVQAARSLFYLPANDERLQVLIGDGADYLAQNDKLMDVILLDAYDTDGIADSLASEDFFARCRSSLQADGLLLVNLWGSDSRFRVYVDRLRRTFDGQVLCLPVRGRGNVVTFCYNRSSKDQDVNSAGFRSGFTWSRLRDRAKQLENQFPLPFSEFVNDLKLMNVHDEQGLYFALR